MAKEAKYKGQFQDRRGGDVAEYHPWALQQAANGEKERLQWVEKIISYIEAQGDENPSKSKLAQYLRNRSACHIIGFVPHVEYFKHKVEGAMGIEGAYVHAFGNPALLVYDKKSKSLLIVGPAIDFDVKTGIRG